MAEDREDDVDSWHKQFMLAKMMLKKYDVLHSFHEQQLSIYPHVCSHIADGGECRIDSEQECTVVFDIKTKQGKTIKKPGQSSYKINYKKNYYNDQCKLSVKNLKAWASRLLWDNQTKVEVYIDGQKWA